MFLLKRTCKKDFGLHLSKTTSFLVIQIAQQSANTAVNNNELYFLVATFDHLIKRSFMSHVVKFQKVYVQHAIVIWQKCNLKRGIV